MVDPFITATRSPQYAGNIVEYGDDTQISVGAGSSTNSHTVNIDSARKSFALIVVLSHADFSSGVLPLSKVEFIINNNVYASYSLPREWDSASRWRINDIVPIIKEFWGSSNTFTIKITFESNISVGTAVLKTKSRLVAIPI